MSDGIDAVALVAELATRARGRACIVLTHDHAGQKQWAAELARQTGSDHLDLLDLFAADPELAGRVQEFSVARLFEHLAGYSEKPVLVVSGLEFLKATWSGLVSAGEEFASQVETWRGTPALLFVMQYDKALADRDFTRHKQYAFVIDQRETIKL
jgi:hypothetical protein